MNGRDEASKVLIALSRIEGLSLRKKQVLLENTEHPAKLASPSSYGLLKDCLGAEYAAAFETEMKNWEDISARMSAAGVGWITYLDDEYPDLLRQIDGYPTVLYYKGDPSVLTRDIIAVVGTRRPTRYGAKIADSFTREFVRAGLVVVSGFARGVDGIAHKACVESDSPTVAVFACGLDVCYPAEHKGLYAAILNAGGVAVSEHPLGVKPLQYHFPQRNRIISGLSKGVFLPEAAKKSGSLITVRMAIEQNRDIFVVPGNINSPESEGCNEILKEMPHAFTTDPSDVFAELRINTETREKEIVELDITQTLVVESLHDEEKHFEELMEITGLRSGELSTLLINLELAGIIEQTAGNYYSLC